MRFVIQAAALALLAVPALAQTPAAPDATMAPPAASAPDTTAPQTAAPATPAAPNKMVGHKTSLRQRFAAANVAHDGHLTKDEATAAKWGYIARHFAAIDTGSKGYVTVDDIRAYAKSQHAMHHKPAAPAATPAPAPAAPPPTNG